MEEKMFGENVSEPSNPPDEKAQNVWKNPVGRIIPRLFLRKFFNYLHDSISIFRAGGN